jgi:ribosomal-protein-alanine N-acetyltransferase
VAQRISPHPRLTFRPMAPDDLDRVIENETRSYAFPWTRGVFSDCLKSRHECWVAVRDNDLLGHGILSIGANEAHLLNVCVRRDQQGNGLGRQIVIHMIDRAERRGATVIYLEVRPSNRVAGALYASLGFREIGLRKDYYPAELGNEDARVLALSLDPPTFS